MWDDASDCRGLCHSGVTSCLECCGGPGMAPSLQRLIATMGDWEESEDGYGYCCIWLDDEDRAALKEWILAGRPTR